MIEVKDNECADTSACAEEWPSILAEGATGLDRVASACDGAARFSTADVRQTAGPLALAIVAIIATQAFSLPTCV